MMGQSFLSDDFLLQTETARCLYHEYAAGMPIFDYHCHLPPADVAEDRRFDNLTQAWLAGDHYKWRAMRSNGVPESLITGDGSDAEKFQAWAATVPYTLRNPLYHWTHMELKQPFGITGRLLGPDTADGIYEECNAMLKQADFSAQGIMRQMNVKVVCTTDDPVDSLAHHEAAAGQPDCPARMLPTFRPDKAMAVEDPASFNAWVDRLEAAANADIRDFNGFLEALKKRHDAFHEAGCRLSDHGLTVPHADPYTDKAVSAIFQSIRGGKALSPAEIRIFKSAMMVYFGLLDAARGWTMQLHFGALRNNNTRFFKRIGADAGFDSMADGLMAEPLSRFLDRLDQQDKLPRTILYVLNPRDNDMIATMIGNFQDGSLPGKIQFGSGWWFNDQKDGMIRQMDALSNMGLLSRFVGMLTDSRSFLSYPRHDYFRRILCQLLGQDVENGELPNDMALLGGMVQDICYNNAVNYFGITPK